MYIRTAYMYIGPICTYIQPICTYVQPICVSKAWTKKQAHTEVLLGWDMPTTENAHHPPTAWTTDRVKALGAVIFNSRR